MGPRGQGRGRMASHKPIHHYWASPRNGSVCTAPGLLICLNCISNTLCFAKGDSLLTYDWGLIQIKCGGQECFGVSARAGTSRATASAAQNDFSGPAAARIRTYPAQPKQHGCLPWPCQSLRIASLASAAASKQLPQPRPGQHGYLLQPHQIIRSTQPGPAKTKHPA